VVGNLTIRIKIIMTEKKILELISRTHIRGMKVKQEIKRLTGLEKVLVSINRKRRESLHKNSRFTMFDSTEVATIPKGAIAVAGYVGGKWPTFHELVQRFKRARRLSIAISSDEDADCLDIETGDATPFDAPEWVRRQKRRGVAKPCLYANLSTMSVVISVLRNAGIHRQDVKLWVAHYTNIPHIEPGFDACQYTNRALGRSLDASLCNGDFLA
jgi:hypothetical protein